MFTVLDVSRWQGRIDWDTVKASGRVHGVMLRALGSRSGTPYIDPMFETNYSATDGSGYTAYTRPGRYDVYDILPTDGTEEEPSPSVYEQFIAQVSGQADAAVQAAQNSAASEANAARQAQAAADAAERAALNGSRAATSASRAESAALRAESFAPEDGTLLSVNGKGGAVVLDAQDVGALPAPVAPQAGALLRVLSIRSDGSLVVDTVTPAALKTLLEAT